MWVVTALKKWRSWLTTTRRPFVIVEELFEPADRLEVEVVCRLVEKERLRIAEERLAEEDAELLVGGDRRTFFAGAAPSECPCRSRTIQLAIRRYIHLLRR